VKKRRESGKIRHRQPKPSGYDILEAYSAGLSGSREGVARLQGIAAIATAFLTSLCQKKPELCAEIARQTHQWPVLFAPHHERKADISKLIDKIELGAARPFELSGTFSFNSPGTEIAFKLICLATTLRKNYSTARWTTRDLDTPKPLGQPSSDFFLNGLKMQALYDWGRCASELPTFCRETVPRWEKPMRQLFRIYYPKPFIDHPDLEELRRTALQRLTSRDKPRPSVGKIESKMIDIVLQSLTAVARQLSTTKSRDI
jgi:hypothetical protein